MRKQEPQRRPTDINAAILEVADLLRADAHEHGATMALDLDEGLPAAIADAIQIQQVVVNLAHNAMEATSESDTGARRVAIRTSRQEADSLEIVVHNTGAEIPPCDATKVFDPFFSTKADGLGMGLSICRTIVEAHGGHLRVTSDADHGTAFHVLLPAAVSPRSEHGT